MKNSQALRKKSESHKQHYTKPSIWKIQRSCLPPHKNTAAAK